MVPNSLKSFLFRGIPGQNCSMNGHSAHIFDAFPYGLEVTILFPEHTRTLGFVFLNLMYFPEHTRTATSCKQLYSHPFRSIPGQNQAICSELRDYEASGFSIMAGKTIQMSKLKQALLLKEQGLSNRNIAKQLGLNKDTVGGYFSVIRDNGWSIKELLQMDDPVLENKLHAGSPAYSDKRLQDFLRLLPDYRARLSDRKLHVTRFILYEEYKASHPDGYSKSQFYFHLKQNLVARKDCETVLTDTYAPGEKLMIDFAGDKLEYVDLNTGEVHRVEVFVACMPYSGYAFATCVPSQKTECFIDCVRLCLEHLGGIPKIVVCDNLKSAVITPNRHEPKLNKAFEDMGNYYRFAIIPCDPRSPTQKSLVEDSVRIIYNRVYARLRNYTFTSIRELNEAVASCVDLHNKTRMQKRPYSREERFHSMEKPVLEGRELPQQPYEMRYYANLRVQNSCFVELRHDNVVHLYSAPSAYVGRMANVIFTRSNVWIYIDGQCVATHPRKFTYGHTYINEHLKSPSLSIKERSSVEYVRRASLVSHSCELYMSAIFNPERTRQPEEVFYKLSNGILSLKRNCEPGIFDQACDLCLEYGIFSYKHFDAVLKRCKAGGLGLECVSDVPQPQNKENTRGNIYR